MFVLKILIADYVTDLEYLKRLKQFYKIIRLFGHIQSSKHKDVYVRMNRQIDKHRQHWRTLYDSDDIL